MMRPRLLLISGAGDECLNSLDALRLSNAADRCHFRRKADVDIGKS